MKKARIGILGSGVVGQVLGAGLAGLGHEVKMGSREPQSDKVKAWVARVGERASAGSFGEAARFADVAVLATLWSGTENALALAGAEHLAGKPIVDATNPLRFSPQGVPELALGHTDSGGEQVQRWLPRSHVVKAFNSVGNVHMINPRFEGGPPDMFLCGDDDAAKRIVGGLCEDLGWHPVDVGGIVRARLLEPLAMLWIQYGFKTGTWGHAFKLLRKE